MCEEQNKRRDCDPCMTKQKELQLYKQYARNNNVNLTSVVTLATVVIVILGFYGYVFVHTVCKLGDWCQFTAEGEATYAI